MRNRNERIDELLAPSGLMPEVASRINDLPFRCKHWSRRAAPQLEIDILRYNPQGLRHSSHARTSRRADGMRCSSRSMKSAKRKTRRCIRLRLPRRYLRQLRDGDRRPSGLSPAAR